MAKNIWDKNKVIEGDYITPNDNGTHEYDALYIGTAGDISVLLRDKNTELTFKNVGNGEIFPLAVKRVYLTGTTAQDIIGLITIKR